MCSAVRIGSSPHELLFIIYIERLGYALILLESGVSVYYVVISRLDRVYASCHKVAYGCAQVGAVLCERLVGSAVQNCCLGLFVQAVGCFILGPVGKSRVGAELEPVKLEYRAHAVNKGLQLVSRAARFARRIYLELTQAKGYAGNFRHGEHAGIHGVHVRRTLHHEAQVFERLRHVYHRRLPRYVGYEHVAGEVGVLGSELGNACPLVLVGVRSACAERGVVGRENLYMIWVVVPVGVTSQIFEAERACRFVELELQVMITGIGINAAAQCGQFCHPGIHRSGSRSHGCVPNGVVNGFHVVVYETRERTAVGSRQAVGRNLHLVAYLRFPYKVCAA